MSIFLFGVGCFVVGGLVGWMFLPCGHGVDCFECHAKWCENCDEALDTLKYGDDEENDSWS